MTVRKRILVAEESDNIRTVAETVLRQGGYEVITVASGEKAVEVLNFTRPDLILLGAELTGKGRRPVYEGIQANPKTSVIPLLLFAEQNAAGLPFPEEVIIPRPFEPKELLEKVSTFCGQAARPSFQQPAEANPFNNAELEDDFLDAALGLDHIEITDSEDMNQTNISMKGAQKPVDKMIGYDHAEGDADTFTDSGRVESLMISDEHDEIRAHKTGQIKKPGATASGTSKLEILNDQYGLIDPHSVHMPQGHQDHDYNWFVNEMQKEGAPAIPQVKPTPAPVRKPEDELKFHDTASMVDPVTPVIAKKETIPEVNAGPAVDKFIDEFKKEIEKFHAAEPDSFNLDERNIKEAADAPPVHWQDNREKMTPEAMGLFTRQFVSELAERLAERIAAKIDSEKLLQLLKSELVKELRKRQP